MEAIFVMNPRKIEGKPATRRRTGTTQPEPEVEPEPEAVWLSGIDTLDPDDMMTVEQILACLPEGVLSRRRFLDGVRVGRYPAPAVRTSRKAMLWRAGNIQDMLRALFNSTQQ